MAKHETIAVIGRGLAGLSVAYALMRRGYENVTIVGPEARPGTASHAAVGVVTLKGWNEPRRPLFVAKYQGHKSLPAWLANVAATSGRTIRHFWGPVYEPFADATAYQWIRQRVYHRDFDGALAVSVISDPPLPQAWGALGAFHYWQDGWVHVSDLLAALTQSITRYRADFIEESVERLATGAGRIQLIGFDGILGSFDQVVLSAGIFSDSLAKASGLSIPSMTGVSGGTISCPLASPVQFAAITGKKTLVHAFDELRYGSTSQPIAVGIGGEPIEDPAALTQTAYLLDFIDQKGYNTREFQAVFGVRARCRDRQPLVGAVPFCDRNRVWLATGFYKNGVQLAHLIAENLVSQMSEGLISPLFRNFLPSRFSSAE